MNCGANSGIRGASADVATHSGIDVGVRGRCIFFKQCGRGHDLAGLTVAALGHLQRDPGGLNRLSGFALEALDGGDLSTGDRRQRHYAGTNRLAI